MPNQYRRPFAHMQLLQERLDRPMHWRKPRTIFVNSMSDTFHEKVPVGFIEDMFYAMRQAPQHTYLLFTKRYARVLEWYDNTCVASSIHVTRRFFRHHVHLYFSASTQAEVNEAVPILLEIQAAKRGLSLEPCLDGIIIPQIEQLDSIIIGAESGPNRRPCKIEWIRDIVRQCTEAGVACYVKQMEINGKVSTNPAEWPDDLRVREMPK